VENTEEIKDKPVDKSNPDPEVIAPTLPTDPANPGITEDEVLFDKECFLMTRDKDGNVVIEDKGTCDPEKYNKMLELIEDGGKTIYRRTKPTKTKKKRGKKKKTKK